MLMFNILKTQLLVKVYNLNDLIKGDNKNENINLENNIVASLQKIDEFDKIKSFHIWNDKLIVMIQK